MINTFAACLDVTPKLLNKLGELRRHKSLRCHCFLSVKLPCTRFDQGTVGTPPFAQSHNDCRRSLRFRCLLSREFQRRNVGKCGRPPYKSPQTEVHDRAVELHLCVASCTLRNLLLCARIHFFKISLPHTTAPASATSIKTPNVVLTEIIVSRATQNTNRKTPLLNVQRTWHGTGITMHAPSSFYLAHAEAPTTPRSSSPFTSSFSRAGATRTTHTHPRSTRRLLGRPAGGRLLSTHQVSARREPTSFAESECDTHCLILRHRVSTHTTGGTLENHNNALHAAVAPPTSQRACYWCA